MLFMAYVKRGSKVIELAPGGGYYTRLLSLAVGPTGRVYPRGGRLGQAITDWAATHPNTRPEVISASTTSLAPEQVDVVWTTLNYHDFKNAKVGDSDQAAVMNRLAWAALKPGGVYLINDHSAAYGSGTSATSTLHRIDEAAVIREVEAAGFQLDCESDALRHAADLRSTQVMETGIRGKTDQFILTFRKVRKPT
jgi:predicted methyltransferase